MTSSAASPPLAIICPRCRGTLKLLPAVIACEGCGEEYSYCDGFPDLIVEGRFDDDDDPDRTAYEEQSNAWLAREYLIPHFRHLLKHIRSPRVLSLGCGTGVDIDLLAEDGFDAIGIDCGNRTASWPRRVQKHRLFLANGGHLPFDSGSFDAVYCGCVFPHIGVEGDSTRVTPEYWQARLAVALEISRVLRPGGLVMVSSPNRLCPLDLFHGRTPDQPLPRLNAPWDPFLLSAADYRTLFREAGCGSSRLLPVDRYWGFIRAKRSWRSRIPAYCVEALFRAVSTEVLRGLRGSVFSPWLVLVTEKSHVL